MLTAIGFIIFTWFLCCLFVLSLALQFGAAFLFLMIRLTIKLLPALLLAWLIILILK